MKKIYLLATVVAIFTGIAVYIFASGLQKRAQGTEQVDMVSVVVAAVNIPQNSTVTAEMLTTALFPAASVPAGAVMDTAYAVGKAARYPISSGEQILDAKIMSVGEIGNKRITERIHSGYRAFTVSVSDVTGVAGYLNIGDKVDIIISKTLNGASETSFFLQNITVIAVGSATGGGDTNEYSNVTLEISAEDCITLTDETLNGVLRLVLRGPGDEEITVTAEVSR